MPVRFPGLLTRWSVGPGVNGLSLWQPWGSLMALGEKRIETRNWPTRYRGAVAIAASAKWDRESLELAASDDDFVAAWSRHPDYFTTGAMKDLPLGAIVAVGHLIACLPTETIDEPLARATLIGERATIHGVEVGETERAFGGYDRGRYGFVVADLHRLAVPVPCKGRQGFWAVVGDTRAALDAAELVRT